MLGDQAFASGGGSLGDEARGLALPLSADDSGAPLLLGARDEEPGSLSLLLRGLLLLNGERELRAVGEVGDGDVLQDDVELARAAPERVGDERRDLGTLGEELVCVELRDDDLENLVADGGEHLVVVLEAQGGEDIREALNVGAREDAEREADHLEVLGAGGGGEVVRAGADVEEGGALQEWDPEVGALPDRVREHPAEAVEDDGALAAVDGVEGRGGSGRRHA
jgi:hypothetical protein